MQRMLRPCLTLCFWLFTVIAAPTLLPATALAQGERGNGGGKSCKPVDIQTTVTVEEIFDIDVRQTSFKAILNLSFRWRLPPVARDSLKVHEVYQSDAVSPDIWQPIYTVKGSRAAPIVEYSYFYMTRDRYGVRKDRLLADIILTSDFRDFPFGRVPLDIQLETLTNIAQKNNISLCRSYSIEHAPSLPLVVGPWSIVGEGSSDLSSGAISIRHELRHTPVFIMFKILIPLLVLTAISIITNINIGRAPDAARWTVVQVTLILVMITLRFALDGVLPEQRYLTFVDKLFAMTLISVFFAIISSLMLHVVLDKFPELNPTRVKFNYRLLISAFYGVLALGLFLWATVG